MRIYKTRRRGQGEEMEDVEICDNWEQFSEDQEVCMCTGIVRFYSKFKDSVVLLMFFSYCGWEYL